MRIILVLLTILLLLDYANARPNPPKTTPDIFNDVYITVDGSPALVVTGKGNFFTIEGGKDWVTPGDRIDFSSTNVADDAYTDLITLGAASTRAFIVNNSGGDFILRIDSTDVGFIAPGFSGSMDFNAASGAVIRIKSSSGTVSTGVMYMNFFE